MQNLWKSPHKMWGQCPEGDLNPRPPLGVNDSISSKLVLP